MDRTEKLARKMACDAAVVTSGVNRFYLTGFSSSAGTLLLTREEAYLIVDARYIQAAREAVRTSAVLLEDDLPGQLRALLSRHGAETVGFETHCMSVEGAQALEEWVAPARLVYDGNFSAALLAQRSIKSPEELALLRQAQEITDAAFSATIAAIRPGVSELDMMMVFGETAARLGCEKRSFNMIFTSGERTSLPHGDPTIRTIGRGDFVMMDVGAMVGGYAADMTRTVAVGEASDEMRDVYATVLAAQRAALGAVRPGACCLDVDAVARGLIDASPYRGTFGHGLGHSLGLEIHEAPRFNQQCGTILEPGMMMTVEPGIYLPGKFGVRIEDMVTVTAEGCENMTKSEKELLVL